MFETRITKEEMYSKIEKQWVLTIISTLGATKTLLRPLFKIG